MPAEYDKINDILIKLTDALGYNSANVKHLEAFLNARGELEDLIDEIDNVETVKTINE